MVPPPGLRGQDITDGHTDFYARFTTPGHVIATLESDPSYDDYRVTREHLRILQGATDARGRRLVVTTVPSPTTVRPKYDSREFAAGYINFYVANGVVLVPEFGDATCDAAARKAVEAGFPGRKVVALNVDAIAWGGGGIHCCTQQQPAPGKA